MEIRLCRFVSSRHGLRACAHNVFGKSRKSDKNDDDGAGGVRKQSPRAFAQRRRRKASVASRSSKDTTLYKQSSKQNEKTTEISSSRGDGKKREKDVDYKEEENASSCVYYIRNNRQGSLLYAQPCENNWRTVQLAFAILCAGIIAAFALSRPLRYASRCLRRIKLLGFFDFVVTQENLILCVRP